MSNAVLLLKILFPESSTVLDNNHQSKQTKFIMHIIVYSYCLFERGGISSISSSSKLQYSILLVLYTHWCTTTTVVAGCVAVAGRQQSDCSSWRRRPACWCWRASYSCTRDAATHAPLLSSTPAVRSYH